MQRYKEHQLTKLLKNSPVLNMDANSNADILQYYITSVKGMNAMLCKDSITTRGFYVLTEISFNTEYVCATIANKNETFTSYYIRKNYRGKGIFKSLMNEAKSRGEKIITTYACGIDNLLKKYEVSYFFEDSFFSTPVHLATAEEFIFSIYGNKRTKRSSVPLINHILEGYAILNLLGLAVDDTEQAYALHPVFQSGRANDLIALTEYTQNRPCNLIDTSIVLNAQTYAIIANSLLYTQFASGGVVPNELYRSKIVKNMLIADKVQNYKDFRLYHKAHKNQDLADYFKYWLESMSITEETFEQIETALSNFVYVALELEDVSDDFVTYGFEEGDVLLGESQDDRIEVLEVNDIGFEYRIFKVDKIDTKNVKQFCEFGSNFHDKLARLNPTLITK